MKPASVIIMDEHPIIRMPMEVLLERNSNIQVVLKTDDSRMAIEHLRTYPIDLIILGIELLGSDGLTLLKRIKSLRENTRVLFLSSKSEFFYTGYAIRAGANGFVNKWKDLNDIYNAVEMTLSGYSLFPSDALNFINSVSMKKGVLNDMPLSNREVTVLRYLANGLSNKEIAEQLLLNNKTISAHKASVYTKLGLRTIIELVDYTKMHELMRQHSRRDFVQEHFIRALISYS